MTKSLNSQALVSDHATQRYLERALEIDCHLDRGLSDVEALAFIEEHEGYDVEICREMIADDVRPAILAGARSVRVSGIDFLVAAGRVTTAVRRDNKLPRKRFAEERRGYHRENVT